MSILSLAHSDRVECLTRGCCGVFRLQDRIENARNVAAAEGELDRAYRPQAGAQRGVGLATDGVCLNLHFSYFSLAVDTDMRSCIYTGIHHSLERSWVLGVAGVRVGGPADPAAERGCLCHQQGAVARGAERSAPRAPREGERRRALSERDQ